ncbi:MAG: Unknown protein [uncultured Thiotrichaceae bacterium]|uniref:histidine kinase n=1 Tax=uncultured Thiotrichaceae bacterium TaxID=298394 RepID=A0A6S6U159_9GAMM|nr:MAG: Unknown protein [uncultured Thiotrichaceae bacterium]
MFHYATFASLIVYNIATLLHNATMASSIKKQLYISHSASILMFVVMIIFLLVDLSYLRTQVPKIDAVRTLTSTAQQLTFLEEKLLLNGKESTLVLLGEAIGKLQALLQNDRELLKGFIDNSEAGTLKSHVSEYQTLLKGMKEPAPDRTVLLAFTRELNQHNTAIRSIINQLELRHHELLLGAVDNVTKAMIFGLIVVSLIALISALFVTGLIVRPLRDLERQLHDVADKKIDKLSTTSRTRELNSFVSQFNNMLDQRRRKDRQLRHNEKAAALGILVSGVAHELNNPLSNISTSAQLLQEEDTNSELSRQWLNHIDHEIERARRIVLRLLDSVRHQKQPMTKVDAAILVQKSLTLIHRQLDPNINIYIEDIAEIPLHVNYERFQQVFINLINNAADAGAKNIWVFGDYIQQADSRTNNFVCSRKKPPFAKDIQTFFLFTVADDGVGIPEENVSKLFVPFFTTKTGGDGTGLGLYLVNEIVTEHDGCISARNREHQGFEFLILLPISEDDS